jgi:type IV pilus assembly protein PilM
MNARASWLAAPPPDAAIEIAPEAVSVATLATRGGEASVHAYASVALPAGAVVPSLATHNIVDPAAVAGALREACERAGIRPRRAALVVPDLSARVSIARFDQIPARHEDLDQLIRWQAKKSSPFPADEISLTYSAGARQGAGGEYIVAIARRQTIREFESVCDDAGIYAGLVDLSTLCVVNLFLSAGAAPAGDWLVVHMRPDYTSIAIMRGANMIFFRNRAEDEKDGLEDVVHQTTMYYQDRLEGRGFDRVLVGGAGRTGGAIELARRDLETHLSTVVEPIDITRLATLGGRIDPTPGALASLAPLVGMLLRTRREAMAV